MPTCGEYLVNLLESYGVDVVFGIPGVHTVEWYRGLANTQIRQVTPRHEQGAGFMADGYARVTGKPGVCFCITGPGMTNIATAMGQALADSIPMLVISSVNPTHQLGMGEGRLHELANQRNLVSGVAVFSHTLLWAQELPKIIARAFAVFQCQRPGPVHIEIPIDIIRSPVEPLCYRSISLPHPPGPAPAAVAMATQLLASAKRPLLAIGGGAVSATKEVIKLAEQLGAPVINTVNAKGVIPYSHPLAVGGSGSCKAIRDELMTADVVLAAGTEFSETDYDFFFQGDVKIDGQLIRIDIDPQQLTRNIEPTIAIYSDTKLALQAISNKLENIETDLETDIEAGKSRAKNLRETLSLHRDNQYAAFFQAIRDVFEDVIIVGDSTQPTYYAGLHYETEQPRCYFHSATGFGTLGYAIPAAIGAKLGQPHRPVVGLIGDGGAQFTIGELASAVEAKVPVIFIVWNNNGYGEIKRYMRDARIPEIGVDIYTPDFVGLSRAFGCEAHRVSTLQALKAALLVANKDATNKDAAGKHTRPTVIEVMQEDFVDGDAGA